MKKPKVIMTVLKEETGFSANGNVNEHYIFTQGEDMEELRANILEAVNLTFDDAGISYEINEIILKPELQSFFDFYKIINEKALSEKTNIDQSLLSQYINGEKIPTSNTTKKIFKGVQQMGKELASVKYFL